MKPHEANEAFWDATTEWWKETEICIRSYMSVETEFGSGRVVRTVARTMPPSRCPATRRAERARRRLVVAGGACQQLQHHAQICGAVDIGVLPSGEVAALDGRDTLAIEVGQDFVHTFDAERDVVDAFAV